jgi:large subunit ribosomal protein L29
MAGRLGTNKTRAVNKAMADLSGANIPALIAMLNETKDELFKLRFRSATGQLDSAAQIQKARKQVARINTVLRQREIEAAEKQGSKS